MSVPKKYTEEDIINIIKEYLDDLKKDNFQQDSEKITVEDLTEKIEDILSMVDR